LGDLKRAGVSNASSMILGDWGWLKYASDDSGWRLMTTRMVLSHYNYRLVPVVSFGMHNSQPNWDNGFYSTAAPSDDIIPAARLHMTKPATNFRLGEPTFKTQRALGDRAIMCDSFEKDFNQSADLTITPRTRPGAAIYGHRDGYNVLYGDGHAAWYGDPQQNIIYWAPSSSLTLDTTTYRYGMALNAQLDRTTLNRPTNTTTNFNGVGRIWHVFDGANGVDKGVDD